MKKLRKCEGWKGGENKFVLLKDQAIIAPENVKHITIGLGWETKADLDASVLLFDHADNLVDIIYYDRLFNENKSIMHSGDIKDGTMMEGDDEAIFIDLEKLPDQVWSIWPVITVSTDNKYFDSVNGAYCRIMDTKSQQEFCRFNLNRNKDGTSTANIVGCLRRHVEEKWSIVAKGLYAEDIRHPDKMP